MQPVSYILLTAGREHTQIWGPKMNIMVAVSHLLITINCSSNFSIYCCKVGQDYIRHHHHQLQGDS